MKRSIFRLARTACLAAAFPVLGLVALAAPASAAILDISGTFNGTLPGGQGVTNFSGSYSFNFDTSVLTGAPPGPIEFDVLPLNSFSLSPNPLGSTTFDTTNVMGAVLFNSGVLIGAGVGSNAGCGFGDVCSNEDGFLFGVVSTPGELGVAPIVLSDLTVSVGSSPNLVEYITSDTAPLFATVTVTSGTTPPPTHVPEPATIALFGFGLAGLGFMRRRKRAA